MSYSVKCCSCFFPCPGELERNDVTGQWRWNWKESAWRPGDGKGRPHDPAPTQQPLRQEPPPYRGPITPEMLAAAAQMNIPVKIQPGPPPGVNSAQVQQRAGGVPEGHASQPSSSPRLMTESPPWRGDPRLSEMAENIKKRTKTETEEIETPSHGNVDASKHQ